MKPQNQEKYDEVFCSVLDVAKEQLPKMRLKQSEQWDSVSHIALVCALENAFGIDIEPDDIFDLTSYEEGKTLLADHYDV